MPAKILFIPGMETIVVYQTGKNEKQNQGFVNFIKPKLGQDFEADGGCTRFETLILTLILKFGRWIEAEANLLRYECFTPHHGTPCELPATAAGFCMSFGG